MFHLKELRKKRGLSQSAVAGFLGISRQNYSFYENNQRDPNTETVKALAEFFGVSTDYLLGHKLPDNMECKDTKLQNLMISMEQLCKDAELQKLVTLYLKLPKNKKALVIALVSAMQEIKQN